MSNQENAGDGQHFKIIVNGREKIVTQHELSYIDVVHLAFENPTINENIVYTVTYKRGPDHKPEGTMVEGDTVKVKPGMIFNVTRTDKS
jgi:hypothetical protein